MSTHHSISIFSCTGRALLRQGRRSTAGSRVARLCQSRQCLRQCRWNSEKPVDKSSEGRPSFHGQVWESTYRRIQDEKAETERYLKERDEKRKREGGGFMADSLPLGFGTSRHAPAAPVSTTPLNKAPKIQHDTSKGNLSAAWSDFVAILGEEHVSSSKGDTERHAGSDWSSYNTKPDERPFMILYPSTTEEVSKIVKICHERKIPITAYSGGTSLEGHFAPTRGGLCIDFSRMNKVIKLNKEDLDVVVQPAVGWEDLNEMLGEHKLFFPPDPGPGAQIGGMVGTGCSGTNAQHYGTMREWVINLTVVLADGTIIKTRQRPRKSSAGYNLTQMFIGSEGTLGLVTEATLKLTVKPQSESVAVCAFPSIRAAAGCVSKVMGEGIPIAAVEILDETQVKIINDAGTSSRKWHEKPTLFFKFTGTPTGVKEQIAQIKSIAKQFKNESFDFASSAEGREELWSARKNALFSTYALRQTEDDRLWTTDVAVPLSRLRDIIEETSNDIKKSGVMGSIVGHVGDGNFHCFIIHNPRNRETVEGVVHRMIKRAIEMEGTTTGEHGVGLVKRDYLPQELGKTTVDAMRHLKLAFDPLCILNCDKVVRVESREAETTRHQHKP